MKNKFECRIGLGDRVRDSITGLEGVVTCVAFWRYGCIRINVQPSTLVDGKVIEQIGFDEPQLEIVRRAEEAPAKPTHGPRPPLTRTASVKR